MALNYGGGYYILKMAKKSGSPAIQAEGIHYRLEGVISTMIGVSFIIGMLLKAAGRFQMAIYVDPMAALAVSIFIIVPSFKLAKTSFFKLLDASMEEGSQIEILKQLSRHIESFCEFNNLKTRTAGRRKFVEFELTIPEDISFRKAHEIVGGLEDDIKEGIDNCEVSIKIIPCDKNCEFIKKGMNCPYLV